MEILTGHKNEQAASPAAATGNRPVQYMNDNRPGTIVQKKRMLAMDNRQAARPTPNHALVQAVTVPVQRIVIPAVAETEEDFDTTAMNFPGLVRQLVQEGNAKRLLYITKYIIAHAAGQEKIVLLRVITDIAGEALPPGQVRNIHVLMEQIKKILAPHEMTQFVALLQRNTVERTQQVLALQNPGDVHRLMRDWIAQEHRMKAMPSAGNWGETVSLVQPLIKLVNSILKHGILSPREARRRGVRTVGSMDQGLSSQISVNTFALVENSLQRATEIARESMGLEDRGSISVSAERTHDPVKAQFPRWEDMPVSAEERQALEKQYGELAWVKINQLKQEKALAAFTRLLNGPLKNVINVRAKGTIMAILDKATTGRQPTNVHQGTGAPIENSSQEVERERPQIKPGHMLELMVPDFVRPYFDLIVNPADIPIRFVGSHEVDAHYKVGGGRGHAELTRVIAPDYVDPIARKLKEHGVISTHIITTNPNRYDVPPDFDEAAAERELAQLEEAGEFD